MRHSTPEHEHNWVAATMFGQQEFERWICLICGQKRVRIVREAPLVEVDHWPSE
jgi:hypothetical protein